MVVCSTNASLTSGYFLNTTLESGTFNILKVNDELEVLYVGLKIKRSKALSKSSELEFFVLNKQTGEILDQTGVGWGYGV